MKFIFYSLFFLLIGTTAVAQLRMPALFSDHMVLQQQTDAPVWGWAAPGEKVVLTNSWNKQVVSMIANDNGIWKTRIKTEKAGGPYTIRVKTDKQTILLRDVLLGEVWVCSGQSNMGFYLESSLNGKDEVARANYPSIRYFDVKRQVSSTPLMDTTGSTWTAVKPDNAGQYSAVAIFFAEKLQHELSVPVGLIEVAWGGTAADNWTPKEVLKNDPKLDIAIKRYAEWQADFKMDSICYTAQIAAVKDSLIEKKPDLPTSMFIHDRPHRAPSVLFNGLINPLTEYGVKGILWYQGETNRKWHTEYAYLFKTMIDSWREKWQADLPFYFVQIAPFKGSIDEVSAIQEAQLQVYRETKNTGIVVTMDVGKMDDIHPTNKRPVGERLANWALSNTYHKEGIVFSGPLYESAFAKADTLQVNFSFLASGLKTEGTPMGFEVLEYKSNGSYKTPKAIVPIIKDEHLIFDIEKISRPFLLRYGWEEQMEFGNLTNSENLPASAFRVLIN